MCASERSEFLAWYECQKFEAFDNRRFLESYSQDVVNVLREACRVLRQEFLGIGNVDVFLESITIASARNKVLNKRFIKPNKIGLTPQGGYTDNVHFSKKAIMWLLYREQTDECTIKHVTNGREYSPPELPKLSADGFCAETRNVYEFSDACSTVIPVYPFVTSVL